MSPPAWCATTPRAKYTELTEVVETYRAYKSAVSQICDSEDLLADPEMRVRQRAAKSLAEIGASAQVAVPTLMNAVFDGEGAVNRQAEIAPGIFSRDLPRLLDQSLLELGETCSGC